MKGLHDPRTRDEIEKAQRTCERLRHYVHASDAAILADAARVLADLVYTMEEKNQETL